jgi:probable phosphoglycerate mutase
MKRAVSTAAPIGLELGLVPQQIQALHERSMGALAGADRHAFRHVYQDAMTAWSAGDVDHTHETAESFRMMQDRGVPALTSLLEKHQGKNESIIVVSHGMLIRVLLASLIPDLTLSKLGEIKIDNVAVNELIWNGQSLEPVRLYDLPDELQNPPEDKPFW